jgi:RNA polymerase sigma-70 factor (ECF subfamily)
VNQKGNVERAHHGRFTTPQCIHFVSAPEPAARSTGDPLTLQVLVAAAGRGDHDAFERRYRLASPKLFGLCIHFLHRRTLAEEALQDVFAQIWRDASDFKPERGEAFPWMARITRNRTIDIARRQANALGRTPEFTSEQSPANDSSAQPIHGPLATLVHSQDAATLHRCLGELTLEQRQSITMAFFHEMSQPQLIEALEAPIGTVKSWVRRGFLALKRCIGT